MKNLLGGITPPQAGLVLPPMGPGAGSRFQPLQGSRGTGAREAGRVSQNLTVKRQRAGVENYTGFPVNNT
jgi:hypothetical protein